MCLVVFVLTLLLGLCSLTSGCLTTEVESAFGECHACTSSITNCNTCEGTEFVTDGSFEFVACLGSVQASTPAFGQWSTNVDFLVVNDYSGIEGCASVNFENSGNLEASFELAATAYKTYLVSYGVAAYPSAPTGSCELRILAAGTSMKLHSLGSPTVDWIRDSFSFEAPYTPVAVLFQEEGSVDSEGTLVDGISIMEIQCLSCMDGYYLNYDERYCCNIPNCRVCNTVTGVCILCDPLYYLDNSECFACPEYCDDCQDSVGCVTCESGHSLDPNTNDCCLSPVCNDCSSNINFCSSCQSGYYPTALGVCELCISDCDECTSPDICQSCLSGSYLNLDGTQCCLGQNCEDCSTGVCSCSDEYFLEQADLCTPCVANCLSCDSSTSCLTCKSGFSPNTNSTQCCGVEHCEDCPSITCSTCEESYYLDDTGFCLQCIDNCLDCADGSSCIACADSFVLSPRQTKCCSESPCDNCNSWFLGELAVSDATRVTLTLEQEVTEPVDASVFEVTLPSYCEWSLEQVTPTELEFLLTFSQDNPADSTLSVAVTGEIMSVNSSCLQQTNWTVLLDEYTLPPQQYERSVPEAVTTGTSASLVASSLLQGDLMMLWSMVNIVQILTLLPLISVKLPSNVMKTIMNLNGFNFFPNIMEHILKDSGQQPYYEAVLAGYDTSDFILNSGKEIGTLTLLSVVWVFLWLALKVRTWGESSSFKKFATGFINSAFARFWIEAYSVFLVNACIQVQHVIPKQLEESSVQSALNSALSQLFLVWSTQILSFLFPYFLLRLSIVNKNQLQDSAFQTKQGVYFEEFVLDKSFVRTQYYMVFLTRRLVLILGSVFARGYPKAQAILVSVLALGVTFTQQFCFVVVGRPFKSRLHQATNTVYEGLLSLIMLCCLPLAFEWESAELIGDAMTGLIYANLGLLGASSIAQLGVQIVQYCKRRFTNRPTVVQNIEPQRREAENSSHVRSVTLDPRVFR